MLELRGQPPLHGLAHGTDFVQRRGMKIRPAKVLDLMDTTDCKTEPCTCGCMRQI